ADRNRDGVLDRKELGFLPPLAGDPAGAPRLFLEGKDLVAVVGENEYRLNKKSLKRLSTKKAGKGK
ncbi:MAG: hypothetical protein ACYTHM_23155, partial [Planctomycetota bacterium]